MAPSVLKAAHLGQITEYLPDRLYLAAYMQPPTADTYFPYGHHAAAPRSPVKRSRQARAAADAAASGTTAEAPCYFTVDDTLLYNAFHHDFGPLHIGHLYRFALEFHEILAAKENKTRPIVFYSRADSRSRANAACLLACYMVLVQNWPPHLALAPIAQIDPPLMPFRDAGYSQADYGITVQDIVYGVWKAREEGCCALDNFDLDEYERFERVENGDFNWITPNFLAFASPQHSPVSRITESSELHPFLPRDPDAVDDHPTLPASFKNVLRHFSERSVGLVVRLNSQLYSPSYFEALGISHIDMIFDDGTCPPLSTVRKFIKLAHETITVHRKGIAVHCKAGLGRTGCLIGAYLIYRHGFTANEVIAFMRFMRPGMVVGPQQHWLHLNQGTFREWWIEERIERKLRKEMMAATPAPSTPSRAMQKAASVRNSNNPMTTTPNGKSPARTPLAEVEQDRNNTAVQDGYLPAPTPGQPRKTKRLDRHHPYNRVSSLSEDAEAQIANAMATATAAASAATGDRRSEGNDEAEDWHLRMRAARKAASQSPERKTEASRYRSFSHSTASMAMTTAAYSQFGDDASNDVENMCSPTRAKSTAATTSRISSASGVLAKVRSAKRQRDAETSPLKAKDAGVRKISGRIGSIGTGVGHASPTRKVSVT